MEITIRPAVLSDASTIAANNRAIALETDDWELDPATLLAGVEALFDEPARGFYLVAEAGGKVVGQYMVTYEWSNWRNGAFWRIQSVYVRPGVRRQGYFADCTGRSRRRPGTGRRRRPTSGSACIVRIRPARTGLRPRAG